MQTNRPNDLGKIFEYDSSDENESYYLSLKQLIDQDKAGFERYLAKHAKSYDLKLHEVPEDNTHVVENNSLVVENNTSCLDDAFETLIKKSFSVDKKIKAERR